MSLSVQRLGDLIMGLIFISGVIALFLTIPDARKPASYPTADCSVGVTRWAVPVAHCT
jgi:hypothetical protein